MFEKIREALNQKDVFSKHLGITVDEISHGYAKASMPHSDSLCNSFGNVHGGASFALADMAFAGVAISSGIATVNISSHICFTAAGKVGPYTALAKLLTESNKLCTIEVAVTDGNDTLIAVLTGTGYKTGKPFAM